MSTLIIYHSGCADGFTAAWVAKKAFPDAELLPAHYGDPIPGRVASLADTDVYVVDFSYPRAELLELEGYARSLKVIDHHKSAKAELEGLDFCVFDMKRSGAMLTWDYFFPDTPAPALVHYVQDRDLWTWKLPQSKEISAALASYPKTLETWDDLARRLDDPAGAGAVVAEGGAAILRYQKQLVSSIAKNAREIDLDGHKVLAVNSPILQSEIGEKLAEGRPFGVVYFQKSETETVFSLRSRPPAGIDVSEVARKFPGGGGHAAAAGFTKSLEGELAKLVEDKIARVLEASAGVPYSETIRRGLE